MVKLGEVCEILDSKRIPITASERVAGEYPYYGANGIQGYINDYIFDDELVLLAEDGGNFGSKDKPIAYRVSGKCWVNNHAHVLKPKNGINVDYLCYSLMYYDVSKLVNGATRQKLTQSDMRKIEIPLVGEGEQVLIVKKLNRIYELVEKRKQQLQKLDELVKARFVEMFGDAVRNEKKWNIVLLQDVCDGIGDGLHGTPQYVEMEGYPFINGNNLVDGKIVVTAATKFVDEAEYNKYYIKLSPSTVLLSINGTLGRLALYKGEKIVLGKSTCYCNLKANINREFVFNLMQTEAFLNFLEKNATKSTIKNVGLKAIRNFELIMPPIELQNRFADFVQQIDKSKLSVHQSLEKLETFKKALMQKYFG